MGSLNSVQTLEVHADAETAWEIVGPNFLNIADWGRGVTKSWDNDLVVNSFAEAPAGGRYCDVAGFGRFDERIMHYDALRYQISWSATGKKLPGFISNLKNDISVEVTSENSCEIRSNITADLNGILGFFLGGLIKRNFTKAISGFLKDWKAYAETGEVSETKRRELERLHPDEQVHEQELSHV